jgi:hypothetical protein
MNAVILTPWRELLARADEALNEERKIQALAGPLALMESMMQRKIRKWAADRRYRMKRRAHPRNGRVDPRHILQTEPASRLRLVTDSGSPAISSG